MFHVLPRLALAQLRRDQRSDVTGCKEILTWRASEKRWQMAPWVWLGGICILGSMLAEKGLNADAPPTGPPLESFCILGRMPFEKAKMHMPWAYTAAGWKKTQKDPQKTQPRV